MVNAGLISLVLALTSLNLHAKGPAEWITFQNVREKLSFACDAMLTQPKDTGVRKDNLQVVRELAIPREQVRNLLAATPAPAEPSLPQRFFARIKAFLNPAPAPATDAHVLIDDLRAPNVSPAARAVLERVAARMEQIQADAALKVDRVPVRNLLRGRLKIQKYVAGLTAQTELLQNHLRDAATFVPAPAVDPAPAPPRPLETGFSRFVDSARAGVYGGVAGLGMVSIFAMDVMHAVPMDLALGAGLYYVSESFRNEVRAVVGSVKSLYRDLRAGPPPPTPAQVAAQRLARVELQLNVYRDMTEHLTGKKPRRGFAYYKYEADSMGRAVEVEHILFTDMKNHAMFTVITDVATRGVTFTRVELPTAG